MASIERREHKDGSVTYKLTVSGGADFTGKRIRYTRTWAPPLGTPRKQADKKAAAAAEDFQDEIRRGYVPDVKDWTFAKWADQVLADKEFSGVKFRTLERYRELLRRINPAIGHMKLQEITVTHLDNLYKALANGGIRLGTETATPQLDIEAWRKKNGLSKAEFARRANTATSTLDAVLHGKAVRETTARAIAEAMGVKFADYFKLNHDVAPLSNKTVLEHHRVISTILTEAEKKGLITFNPAARATKPKIEKHTADYYQPDEIDRILEALEEAPLKWRTLTYLLIDTGCRRGEAVAARWDHIDFTNGVFTIDRALLYSANREAGDHIYLTSTKTGAERAVKLAPQTLALLREQRRAQLELRFKNGDRWHETGYCFTRDDGQPINPDSVTSWLRTFSKDHDLPHIHPHAFRHTAASTMIASGVDLVSVASELGHASSSTTANIYAHQIAEARAKASESRASVFTHRDQGEHRKLG